MCLIVCRAVISRMTVRPGQHACVWPTGYSIVVRTFCVFIYFFNIKAFVVFFSFITNVDEQSQLFR